MGQWVLMEQVGARDRAEMLEEYGDPHCPAKCSTIP